MFSTEEEKRYVKMEEINLSPEISNVSIIVILTHGRIYTCIWSTKLTIYMCLFVLTTNLYAARNRYIYNRVYIYLQIPFFLPWNRLKKGESRWIEAKEKSLPKGIFQLALHESWSAKTNECLNSRQPSFTPVGDTPNTNSKKERECQKYPRNRYLESR